jgi:hypothetical protein
MSAQVSVGHMFLRRILLRSAHGVAAALRPVGQSTTLAATVENRGHSVAYVMTEKPCGWRIVIVNDDLAVPASTKAGRLLKAAHSALETRPNLRYVPLEPGKSVATKISLRKYFLLVPGKYFVQVTRPVGFGTGDQPSKLVWIACGPIELTISANGKITWRTRDVKWPVPPPRKIPPGPRVEFAELPQTGPIAALAGEALAGAPGTFFLFSGTQSPLPAPTGTDLSALPQWDNNVFPAWNDPQWSVVQAP